MIKTSASEEKKMVQDEKYIKEYKDKVEAFLSKNEKNRAEAFIRAEEATKARLQKVAEIKNISIEIMKIRSSIAKEEDKLMDTIVSKNILEMLTPKEMKEKKMKERLQKSIGKTNKDGIKVDLETIDTIKGGSDPTSERKPPTIHHSLSDAASLEERQQEFKLGNKESESEVVPEIYFESPQEVLDIFYEMEEQTLLVLQYYQELEEGLDKIKAENTKAQKILNHKAECLKLEVEALEAQLDKEKQKTEHFILRVNMFTGPGSAEDEMVLLDVLNKAINKLYQQCCDSNVNLSSVHKLAGIESEINKLMDLIETGVPEKTEIIRKQKQKAIRERQRGEILSQIKKNRDRKMKRMFEKNTRIARKTLSRKLMYRSKPPESQERDEINITELALSEHSFEDFFNITHTQ
ncbi:coiled-coil domain-containing protein 38-like [Callorhinchus milii]|uniref:coiled-coil domain-containing protein 38 n=1 Tax=Callorhinchus milii TaxID=7868 RepID=UPI001C3FAD0A|nr:coiled-coil domain-containing protein 38 [Callorhinchus milii]XP_042190952.1 coiled-coil domain-containing protein 38-like [Callorhinchus milii]